MKVRAWCCIFVQLVFDAVLIILTGWVITHCIDSFYIPVNHLNNKTEIKNRSSVETTAERKLPRHDDRFISLARSAKDRTSTDSNAATWGENKIADHDIIYTANKNFEGK